MLDRENWVGMILVAVCAVLCGILLWSIATGATFTYNGPEWIPPVLTVLFIGGLILSFVRRVKTRI